jgi:hypothetical protein
MKRIIWLSFAGVLLTAHFAFAADIVITLNFPHKSTQKMGTMKALPQEEPVSGTITLDISPYPHCVCLVKYYLAGELVYSTNGRNEGSPDALSFAYALDTTLYDNGEYRLYVNYFDSEGKEAVGSKKIVIINKQ